jgi:hypothetical protein
LVRDPTTLPDTHECSRCKQIKSRDAFNKNARYKSGLQSYCKECAQGYGRGRFYDITPEQFSDMFDAQHGKCATCDGALTKKGSGTHVDHCHTSGRVRGLLCRACNTALGGARDDPETLRRMIAYVESHAVD